MERCAIRRTESQLAGSRGHALFHREWLHPRPERALLFVHGLAEHSGRYERAATWFAARGCAVHAYDHRGHGKSAGVRGHVAAFSHYLDDLEIVLQRVRERHPGLPVFPVGHSMGGLVVAALACERRPDVAGIATSGAALQLVRAASAARIFAVQILGRALPRLRLNAGLDPNGLSRDPEVVRAYVDDPLVFRSITARLALELSRAIPRTASGGAGVRVPMLMLHGESDPICSVEGSRRFFEQLPLEAKGLRTYPGLLHEIFNEPERETAFEDLLDWVRQLKG